MLELANRSRTLQHSMPVSRVPFTRTQICEEARQAVQEVLASGWVTSGQHVIEFEREFAEHVGARRAVAVSSCTAALELALRALHLPAGSRVLMSTDTFCGAASAIVHAGLQLVLADVDPITAMPSPATVAAAVRGVGGVHAMVVVHLGGLPTQVEEMAEAAGITLDHVVEDAAHALGSAMGDRVVGTIARATCFSFYATKNLAIGEGGMLTTDDDELADAVGRARLHGMSKDAWKRYRPGAGWRYDVEADGLKANMTDVQAVIGRAQLRQFEATQARRAEVAARYDSMIVDIPGLTLPLRPLSGTHAWHLYAVRVRPSFGVGRDDMITALSELGIGTSVHFTPVHRLTWYSRICLRPPGGFPGADSVFDQTLSLPMDQVLTDDDVETVCKALAEIGGSR
jgi:dTDP-4-amino-4,6-dideoxygalactose transaminase